MLELNYCQILNYSLDFLIRKHYIMTKTFSWILSNDFQISSSYSTYFISSWSSFLLIWCLKIFLIWYFSCLFMITDSDDWWSKMLDSSWVCFKWMIEIIKWIFQLAESFNSYVRLLIFHLIENDSSLSENNFDELKLLLLLFFNWDVCSLRLWHLPS